MATQINKCSATLVENLKVEADNKRTFDFKTTCDAFTMDCIASTAFGLTIDSRTWWNMVGAASKFSPENCDSGTLDPMRFMPFGAGPRNCVGVRLAKMEIKMAAVHLIRNFRFVVTEETDVPPVFEKLTIKNVNGIKVGVESR
ncbi:hypothetical protein HELRODRAFT_194912 [Helobdella robusta]|uniref:Cytochrome P450 n=1 Tax=Helobdella robusta TaxID=6412 RepID=T1FWK1_HELRO|nr:hypothetical protein HELRODRAFT_194912 [Helobdella robusta]ESO10504.1 hypothetical protein HELRODRAFT_194912 [Helobdella robusta]